jgi:SulP family sulfate permease
MLNWLRHYRRDQLAGDLGAGVVVAMMLIPQGMAYALVAGLPPVLGLYASILPAVLYALVGTSMTQSVGPMVIVSLMTASALTPLAEPGSGLYMVLAGQLSLLVGAVLLACGLLRVGFLSGFFSRPVMSGFTIGAALLIAWGQLGTLAGGNLRAPHTLSIVLGGACMLALLAARRYLPRVWASLAPMAVVLASLLATMAMGLGQQGVATIGEVPGGLPGLNLATSQAHWEPLLKPALLIAFIVFLVSMSSAQTLALKRGERIDSNRELAGLGLANIGSALSGAFPVTGSISRSAVNFAAGAQTPLATVVTAVLMCLALVAPTGWLSLLPLPALAATIIVAVLGMLEWDTLRTAWRYDRSDALALVATAAGVIGLGVEAGVVVGVALSIGTMIWRASRPHIAVLGRIGTSEHFRNIERFPSAETVPNVLILRIDANLFFANVDAVHARIEEELAQRPDVRHLVLMLASVSAIDTTGLFALGEWNDELQRRNVTLHFAEVKGPVMDRLRDSDLLQRMQGRVFLSTAIAAEQLA